MTDTIGLIFGDASKIPYLNIPIWFPQYLRVRGQAHLLLSNFAKLCKDFSCLGVKPYMGPESYVDLRAWIYACERIFSLMGLIDVVRRKLVT